MQYQSINNSLPEEFDWNFYLYINPDLVNAGIFTEFDAVNHFLQHGQKENRLYCKHKLKISNNSISKVINTYYSKSSSGIGDFLRGCIYLYEVSDQFNFNFEIDLSLHQISRYIKSKSKNINTINQINDVYFDCVKKYGKEHGLNDLKNVFEDILNSNKNEIILSSMYSDKLFQDNPSISLSDNFQNHKFSEDGQKFMQSNLIFSEDIIDSSQKIFNLNQIKPKEFNVVHLRLGDFCLLSKDVKIEDESILNQINFKNYQMSESYLLNKIKQIIKKDNLPIVIMSDSNKFKNYLLKSEISDKIIITHDNSQHCSSQAGLLFYTDQKSLINDNQLFNIASDLHILSQSKNIYSYSVYPWGSGFSYSIAKIYNIPLKIEVLSE